MRPWQRRPLPAPTAAELLIASDRFQDLPYGGLPGEMLAATPQAPAPLPPQPIEIPPPPWHDSQPEVEPPAPDTAERLTPVEAMRLADGYEPDPLPIGPPEVSEPLVRFTPPPADWRREEAERNRKPRPLGESEKSLGRRPA